MNVYSGSAANGIGPESESIESTAFEFVQANEMFFDVVGEFCEPNAAYVFTPNASDDLANGVNRYGASA